jgi:hypothetical protein
MFSLEVKEQGCPNFPPIFLTRHILMLHHTHSLKSEPTIELSAHTHGHDHAAFNR